MDNTDLKYDSLYCSIADGLTPYLTCFKATPRPFRFVCDPAGAKKLWPSTPYKTGGWMIPKDSSAVQVPKCPETAKKYQAKKRLD